MATSRKMVTAVVPVYHKGILRQAGDKFEWTTPGNLPKFVKAAGAPSKPPDEPSGS